MPNSVEAVTSGTATIATFKGSGTAAMAQMTPSAQI